MRIVYILLALTTVISCQRGEDAPLCASGFRLRVSVEGVEGIASKVEGVASKVDAFGSGDAIGVYLANVDMGLLSSGNAANNAHFTYDGTTWQASDFGPSPIAGSASRIGGTDAGSGTSGNVVPSGSYLAYGYYPYHASVDDARQVTYTLPLDQSAGIDKSKSLAWGRIKSGTPIVVDSKTAGAIDVELTFTNCLARVTIKGNMPAKYNNRNVGDVTGIKLLGAQKQCKLDLATGRLITDPYAAARSTVTMYKNSYDASTKTYNYSAIAIPATILPSAPLAVVTFTYNDGTGQSDEVYLYADEKGTALRGNTHHTITSNVDYLDCYTEFAFAAAGSTQVADIKTNIATPYTLTVKFGADWLTVSGDSASGYSVTATANTTTINRMGELVLSNGTLTRSIAVLQLK